MKKILLFLFLLHVLAFSQTKKSTEIPAQKELVISGCVSCFPDDTSVSFVNNQTNQLEKQTSIEKNKFMIKGEMQEPGFKILVFNEQAPGIPLFLDNSSVKIKGDKSA